MIEPIKASLNPTFWSSNFGQRIPGVSRSSTCLFRRIHCFPLVTPGLLPVFAQAFPASALIKVDFPTLGIPTTMARTGRLRIPLFRSRSIFSLQASWITPWMDFNPPPFLEFNLTTKKPFSLKYSAQASFHLSSARSALFRRIILDLFFPSSSISGFLLLTGILASTSSITRSINFIFSCIIRFAFVI